MILPDVVRNAIALGLTAGLVGLFARTRLAIWLLPPLLALGGFAAWKLEVIDLAWAAGSLGADAPWLDAALLAGWWALAGSGVLRLSRWWAVVGAAALLGDGLVAGGLALAEPDAARRARLVVAAGAASMIGPASGEAALVLGWGGLGVAALGLGLSFVGFTRGGALATARPQWGGAARGAAVALMLAPGAWLAILSGVPEFAANLVEQVPLWWPGKVPALFTAVAAAGGAVFHEGGGALFAQAVLERAFALRSDLVRQCLLVGASLGGSLTLLLATGARLRTGLPLWLLQLLLAMAWLSWRWS